MTDFVSRLASLRSRIDKACVRSGRDPKEVDFVAVSKKKSNDLILEAYEAGIRVFGESRVQEAKLKVGSLPQALKWHMIGHLQTNKARDAVGIFSMIQSVNSMGLAIELQKWCERFSKTIGVLIQVNVSGEASKHGFHPDEMMEIIVELNGLDRLEIHGLMTLAPWTSEPERARPFFRRLREIRTECEDRIGAPLPVLSMGMSGDFEIAIEEGSTMIRIGTGLFGPR